MSPLTVAKATGTNHPTAPGSFNEDYAPAKRRIILLCWRAMKMRNPASTLTAVVLFSLVTCASSGEENRILAFPGAEGYGAYAKGGRGGRVIAVTNVNEEGPGSLRMACDAEGPRTVVFRTGGTIRTAKPIAIRHPYITIAGQTAPGDGICIRGAPLLVNTHDVVVRGLRIRVGDDPNGSEGSNRDGIWIGSRDSTVHDVIVDHCSISWAIDENVSTWYPCHDITIQWCIVSEALQDSLHSKGPHSMGLLIGDHTHRLSVHHNLLAHNNYRNPQLMGDTTSEIVNNVVYNWRYSAVAFDDPKGNGPSKAHIVANTFIPGPDTERDASGVGIPANMQGGTQVYLLGNKIRGDHPLVRPRPSNERYLSVIPVLENSGLQTESADKGYERVLSGAGATFPRRDVVDRRLAAQVVERKGGIVHSQAEVGGWPDYRPGESERDSDSDGMPDEWELKHGLDPHRPDNNGDDNRNGYANIEEFLNGTDPVLKAHRQPEVPPDGGPSRGNVR